MTVLAFFAGVMTGTGIGLLYTIWFDGTHGRWKP